MRITPVNYSLQANCRYDKNCCQSAVKKLVTPSFGYGFDDASFLDEPSNGYSILDLIEFLRHGKVSKPTMERIDEVFETREPDLGDISDITDTDRNNSESLDEELEELCSGKCDNKPFKKEFEKEPPSIFVYTEDES